MEPEKAKQPPSVPRMVHYYRPGTTVDDAPPLAAVITHVSTEENPADAVELFVFDSGSGNRYVTACYSSKPYPGRWTYPPYVPPAIVDKQPMATLAEERPTKPPPPDDSNAG